MEKQKQIEQIINKIEEINSYFNKYTHIYHPFQTGAFFSQTLSQHFKNELTHIHKDHIESYLKISNHLDSILLELTSAYEFCQNSHSQYSYVDNSGNEKIDPEKIHDFFKRNHPKAEAAVRHFV